MKVTGVYNTSSQKVQFSGVTQKIPQIAINSAQDLQNQYHYLRFAKYYEALDKAHTTGNYTDFVKLVTKLEVEMLKKYLELL